MPSGVRKQPASPIFLNLTMDSGGRTQEEEEEEEEEDGEEDVESVSAISWCPSFRIVSPAIIS